MRCFKLGKRLKAAVVGVDVNNEEAAFDSRGDANVGVRVWREEFFDFGDIVGRQLWPILQQGALPVRFHRKDTPTA